MEQLPRDLVFKQTQHIVELATVWHYNASVPWLQATLLLGSRGKKKTSFKSCIFGTARSKNSEQRPKRRAFATLFNAHYYATKRCEQRKL